MIAVLSRIIARYGSGALVTIGFMPPEMAEQFAVDPDVALVLGAALGAVTEGVYAFAKKRGWTT